MRLRSGVRTERTASAGTGAKRPGLDDLTFNPSESAHVSNTHSESEDSGEEETQQAAGAAEAEKPAVADTEPVLPTVIATLARRGSVALMAANMQRNMERQQRMQNQLLMGSEKNG